MLMSPAVSSRWGYLQPFLRASGVRNLKARVPDPALCVLSPVKMHGVGSRPRGLDPTRQPETRGAGLWPVAGIRAGARSASSYPSSSTRAGAPSSSRPTLVHRAGGRGSTRAPGRLVAEILRRRGWPITALATQARRALVSGLRPTEVSHRVGMRGAHAEGLGEVSRPPTRRASAG